MKILEGPHRQTTENSSIGRVAGMVWKPTSGYSPLRCPACGSLAKSEELAKACCSGLVADHEQHKDADSTLDPLVVELFNTGHTPSEIASKLGVRNARINACYTRTREALKRDLRLTTNGLRVWRNKRRKEVGLPELGIETWRKG